MGWSPPYICHRVFLHQPNAIARIAGGCYAHSRRPLASTRSLSPRYPRVSKSVSTLRDTTPYPPGPVYADGAEPRDRHPVSSTVAGLAPLSTRMYLLLPRSP